MLEMILLTFQLVGFMVVTWSVYSICLGTYYRTCVTIEKKLLGR